MPFGNYGNEDMKEGAKDLERCIEPLECTSSAMAELKVGSVPDSASIEADIAAVAEFEAREWNQPVEGSSAMAEARPGSVPDSASIEADIAAVAEFEAREWNQSVESKSSAMPEVSVKPPTGSATIRKPTLNMELLHAAAVALAAKKANPSSFGGKMSAVDDFKAHIQSMDDSFVGLLQNTPIDSFASYRYIYGGSVESRRNDHWLDNLPITQTTYYPGAGDTAAHLKLLRAFSVMKAHVIGNHEPDSMQKDYDGTRTRLDENTEKIWQVFVTNAFRRFIVFTSCLKFACGIQPASSLKEKARYEESSKKDATLSYICSMFLPPLDVLMVWHAFLLNPRAFYANFMRNDFYKFANMPFPFHMIHPAIDDETFEYSPAEPLQKAYLKLLEPFTSGNIKNQVLDLSVYDVSRDFDMYRYTLDVSCPGCDSTLLRNVPYTNDSLTGFADSNFKGHSPQCSCQFSQEISHNELRKRQLYSDMHSPAVLPGIFQYFSSILSHEYHAHRDCIAINGDIILLLKENVSEMMHRSSLEKIIAKLSKLPYGGRETRLISRIYLNMNLIQTTIRPPPENALLQVFEISEDLVGAVIRQGRFVEKMNGLNWPKSSTPRSTIMCAIGRYKNYFRLLTQYDINEMLVPTLDIDLIWHTHLLSAHYYFKDCLESDNKIVIDHDDKVESGRLDRAFERTEQLYRLHYKHPYSICLCWYCVKVRAGPSQSILRRLLKLKIKDEFEPLGLLYDVSSTHVSIHSAIERQSHDAMKQRRRLRKKYTKEIASQSTYKKDVIGDAPWDVASREIYRAHYVIPPTVPIPKEHDEFYAGLCSTVRDYGPNCGGISSCIGSRGKK